MNICPKCGCHMGFNMKYVSGSPFVYYTCNCGYDSANEVYTYDYKTHGSDICSSGIKYRYEKFDKSNL